ncbi:MAG: pitrilysin family protein, partial [Chloroflexi bacterium]|nr:pitrilysin family protein [Chloroflexota bacterium]
DQPMGWDIGGTVDTAGAITREDVLDYMQAWYAPNNMVVAAAGNLRHDEVVRLCEQWFGGRQAGELGGFAPAGPRLGAEPVIVETRAITQANLGIATLGLSRHDPERWAMGTMSNILGRGMSSRLFKEVRERRGLAYSVGCGASRYTDTGMFSAHAGVSGENVVEATEVILQEFRRIADERVSEDELSRVREYSAGDFRLGLEDSMAVARWIGEHLATMDEAPDVERIVGNIRGVTADQVQAIAQRLFAPGGYSVAVTGPQDDTARLRDVVGL